MSVKKIVERMIAHLKAAVKKLSQALSQTIPNLESPGNYLASDLLTFLVRRDEPGLASLFPLMAASIVAALLPAAASPLGVGR